MTDVAYVSGFYRELSVSDNEEIAKLVSHFANKTHNGSKWQATLPIAQ